MDTNRKEQGGTAPKKREDQPRPQEKQQAGAQQQQHRKDTAESNARAQQPPKDLIPSPRQSHSKHPAVKIPSPARENKNQAGVTQCARCASLNK
ncbi:hypothetical protein [Marinobacterium aestuariivivens]|uniref:Uncharacterized protein n=1 Tax=Marinobacterium aestuariivivens TaxID=1698799 RepID=A0ABW2A3X9_9GAMM